MSGDRYTPSDSAWGRTGTGTVRMPTGCTRWGAHWRHLANKTEPFACSGDGALCPITLITCCICCCSWRRLAVCCWQAACSSPIRCVLKATWRCSTRSSGSTVNAWVACSTFRRWWERSSGRQQSSLLSVRLEPRCSIYSHSPRFFSAKKCTERNDRKKYSIKWNKPRDRSAGKLSLEVVPTTLGTF